MMHPSLSMIHDLLCARLSLSIIIPIDDKDASPKRTCVWGHARNTTKQHSCWPTLVTFPRSLKKTFVTKACVVFCKHCCMPSHIPLLFSSGYCVLEDFLNIRCKRDLEQLKTGLKENMFPSAHSFTHCLLSRTFPPTSLSIYAIPCFRR